MFTAFEPPPPPLRNPYVQMMLAGLRGRQIHGDYRVFPLRDNEYLVGFLTAQTRRDVPLAVLVHGWEGSSESAYIRRMAIKMFDEGWHVLRLNLRGCGPRPLTQTLNHLHRSDDLADVIGSLQSNGFTRIALVGFSLGGGMVLNVLADHGAALSSFLLGGAVISPLVNPSVAQQHADRSPWRRNLFLYLMRRRLKRRVNCRTAEEFDARCLAPSCGCHTAQQFYQQVDPLRRVSKIVTPTLLIHAQDDPVIPFRSYQAVLEWPSPIERLFPRHGGHLGFWQWSGYWAEEQVVRFLKSRAA